ncbi:hypothetical protein HUW51_10400 [Adhaeribacter swui]|uniref:Uncharacterized protein n=1 Tax=Adhaeribacter swui TaxID=2086471 RepID=A0A7G7G7I3_9BACT|nr:hypothetical protein [Adhaeribacter swui]QNF33117.1 hypothetical protein HUW51_10400 [Adhaeribacter swui]
MKPLQVIWQKILVYPYYRDNTGFFFFWIMLLVVFQNPGNRLFTEPFLSSVIQTPVVLSVILGVLLLYFLKCYRYVKAKLTQPEHEFLFLTSLLPVRIVWFSWLLVFAGLYAPALLYLSLLLNSAIKLQTGFICCGLLGFGLVATGFFTGYFTWLHHSLKSEIQYTSRGYLRFAPTFNSPWFILGKYIWQEATGLFLLTKLFCLTVTWFFLKFYPSTDYGVRLAAVGFLMGLAGHSLLVFRMHLFAESRLLVLRQLPFTNRQRFMLLLVAYSFALLPEGLFLLSYIPLQFPTGQVIFFYGFGLGFLLFLHTWLYRSQSHQNYYQQIFYLFISLLFLILFSVPVWLLAGILLLLSFGLLQRFYYRFEASW